LSNVCPMLVSVIDINLLVIATNSSMSWLLTWLGESQPPSRRQFPRFAFPCHHFPRATLRPERVIYGVIVRPHEAGLTRFRGLASRYEMQQPAPLTRAHHHIEFALAIGNDVFRCDANVLWFKCNLLQNIYNIEIQFANY